MVPLREIIRPTGGRAGTQTDLPVYSVTKHDGFVPSLEYFKKQVFSREVDSYKLVQPGDFAYATIHLDEGSIGIAPERGLISPMYTVFRSDDSQVDPNYLIRFLKGPRALTQYAQLGRGAVHRRMAISLAALGSLLVPLPHLKEQQRIAAILDRADAIRAKRRQVLAHLDSLTQSIFHDMFEATTWPIESLSSRLQFLTSGSRGWSKYYAPTGDKFIRIQNVRDGYLSHDDMARVAAPSTAEAKRTAVHAGDVLLSITADLGRTAVVPDGLGTAYVNQHLAILRAPSLNPRYLADFLGSPQGQREVMGRNRGATKAGLNFDDVRSVRIPIPPPDIQELYAAKVAHVMDQRTAVSESLIASGELFASLQYRAFRGEL